MLNKSRRMNTTKMEKMEYRHIPFEMKQISADDPEGVFEGYGAYFGNVDSHLDVIERGAFLNSLQEKSLKSVKILSQHDVTEIVGVPLEIREDDRGLYLKARLLINSKVPEADKLHTLMKEGVLDGLSIGFIIRMQSERNEQGIRTIKEINLMEISIVTFPSNSRAQVLGVKSNTPNNIRDLERRLRDAVGFSRVDAKKYAKAYFEDKKNLRDAGSNAEIDFEDEGLRDAVKSLKDVIGTTSV